MPHILYVILQVVWFAHLVSYLTEPRRGVKQKFKVVEVRHRVEDNQERGPESCRRPFSKMMVGTIKLGPLIVTEEDYRKVNFSSCISLPHFPLFLPRNDNSNQLNHLLIQHQASP
jgi:hypothetical protein